MQKNEYAFSICVSQYFKIDDVVHYQLIFLENSQRLTFSVEYRYSHLKKLYESLLTLKKSLPRFPSSYWWRSTLNDELIEERRVQLDYFFRNLLECKEACKSLIFKNFILSSHSLFIRKIGQLNNQSNDAGAESENQKQKPKSAIISPVLKPDEDPVEDPIQRSRSWEFEFSDKNIKSSSKLTNQLGFNKLSFRGTPVFKGLITRIK